VLPASVNRDPCARALRAMEEWIRGAVEAWTRGSGDGEWGLLAADPAKDQLVQGLFLDWECRIRD
jgi:hypothetical protein